MFRLLLAPRREVHLGTTSHQVECNVQTDTRTLSPRGRLSMNRQKKSGAGRTDDSLCTSDDSHAAVQVKKVSLWGNI